MSKFAALALSVDTPARLNILHPKTGLPLTDANGEPAWIDLLSLDSKEARDLDRAETQRRIDERVKRIGLDEAEQVANKQLAAITKGWRLIGLDGTVMDVPCTAGNAFELYSTNSMLWLRDQVQAFVGTRANFLPVSSKT